jgi:hypothetical protein
MLFTRSNSLREIRVLSTHCCPVPIHDRIRSKCSYGCSFITQPWWTKSFVAQPPQNTRSAKDQRGEGKIRIQGGSLTPRLMCADVHIRPLTLCCMRLSSLTARAAIIGGGVTSKSTIRAKLWHPSSEVKRRDPFNNKADVGK